MRARSCRFTRSPEASTGSLLLNEIAPRPHNSGHYTIEACNISQYTAHLYAILSIPIPPIVFIPASAGMLNLLGWSSSASDDFLQPEGVVQKAISMGAAVHLYGKKGCRKARKMGHVTVLGESDAEVREKITQLVACLPGDYKQQDLPQSQSDAREPLVSIIMGSDSDLPVMLPATRILEQFGVPFETSIVSAHRTPARMVSFARTAADRGVRVIIAGAGGAAHLPGMVASETSLPVLGVPVKASVLDGVDSLYSIVQMPVSLLAQADLSENVALLTSRLWFAARHSCCCSRHQQLDQCGAAGSSHLVDSHTSTASRSRSLPRRAGTRSARQGRGVGSTRTGSVCERKAQEVKPWAKRCKFYSSSFYVYAMGLFSIRARGVHLPSSVSGSTRVTDLSFSREPIGAAILPR